MVVGFVIACLAVVPLEACVIERRTPVFTVDNGAGVRLTIYEGVARDVKIVEAGSGVTGSVVMGRVGDDGCSPPPGYVAVADDGRTTVPRRVCDRDVWKISPADLQP
jgi:hypothetical protein